MPRPFPTTRWRTLLIFACTLACIPQSRAQYNASFDSAYRAAAALPDPIARLARLRPLVSQGYESSVFQTISFGKAYLQAATEAQRDTDLYQAHVILCTGYERARDYEQSVDHGLQAVNIAARRKEYLKQILTFLDIAFTYSSMGSMSGNRPDMDKALYYCDQALKISKAQGIKSQEPAILTSTADVYAMNKKYDTAIALYRRAIASRREQGLGGSENLYGNLGIALDLHGDYNAALAAYDMADSISDAQHKGDFHKTKIASNRAILYSNMGRLRESEQIAQEVLKSAQQTGAMDMQVDMVEHLKNLYRKEGRYPEALDYADSLAAIKERVLNAEKTGQVAEMQARYDAGVKDQQIAGQQAIIQQKRRQNGLLWGGIALLAIAGCTAYLGMRRSRQLNKKITVQQQQLLLQKAELQRINEMKDQLFSLIGHDLRTPLNSLTAYATLLEQEDALSPEKAKQYSTDLRLTLGYTAALMENLLHFAKAQMQATRAYPEVHSLTDITAAASALLQPAMTQKKIRLLTDLDADSSAWCDEDMTELILRNLLGNAIKFSAPGSSINLSVKSRDAAFIACTVADSGAGMDPALVALWNSDEVPAPVRSTAGTQHEKGAGLGLMLSKTFAGMMSGSLQVKSEAGKGSAFTLLLPRKDK